jgi:hypothetical protein
MSCAEIWKEVKKNHELNEREKMLAKNIKDDFITFIKTKPFSNYQHAYKLDMFRGINQDTLVRYFKKTEGINVRFENIFRINEPFILVSITKL